MANTSNFKEYNKPVNKYQTACEVCGKLYEVMPSMTRGRFCSRKCFGQWQSENITGDKHPSWRGGYKEYYGPSWRAARRKARARDKVCQDCGKAAEQNGKALDVHHIEPFRSFGIDRHLEANHLTNLVSLCMSCHTKRDLILRREERALS